MTRFERLKTAALALLIMVGAGFHHKAAHAAELETLTVAGGCFWCVEADFEKVDGVTEVISGFTGGTVANPSYKEVVRGNTGHYEAVEITFDPAIVSRERLLELFVRSIDPTDTGGQFCDRGAAYLTAIFASDEAEAALANRILATAEQELGQPIVTPVLPEAAFYPAEAGHQDYYKSDALTITRFGPRKKSVAYKLYRDACGRDQRVRQLWGDAAPFVGS